MERIYNILTINGLSLAEFQFVAEYKKMHAITDELLSSVLTQEKNSHFLNFVKLLHHNKVDEELLDYNLQAHLDYNYDILSRSNILMNWNLTDNQLALASVYATYIPREYNKKNIQILTHMLQIDTSNEPLFFQYVTYYIKTYLIQMYSSEKSGLSDESYAKMLELLNDFTVHEAEYSQLRVAALTEMEEIYDG